MDPHAAIWEHCLDFVGLSDVGLRRTNNQDSLAIMLASSQEKWDERGHLFVVADGMGAHAAGELASKLATDVVQLTYDKAVGRSPSEALLNAVVEANSQIHAKGMASDDFRGMGTTVSALVLAPCGALIGHVGDSRVYRLRDSRLEQLTFDHSLVWELRAAKQSPDDSVASFVPKNIITRSLGPNPHVQVDIEGPLPIQIGDTFLLCSDGLSGQLQDGELAQVLWTLPPKEAARALIDIANLRGGPDNITVIVARVTGPQKAKDGPTASSPASHERNRPPVHPALWSTIGVLALAASLLLAIGQTIAAVAVFVAAVVASVVAVVQKFSAKDSTHASDRRSGRAPYVVVDGTPTQAFAANLGEMTGQLRDAATNAGWQITWDAFRRHQGRAAAAAGQGKYADVVREHCRAISSLMEQLRNQSNGRPPGRKNSPRLT